MTATTITIKGQVTIPKEIRDKLGLKPGDKVLFEREGKRIFLKPAKTMLDFKGYVETKRYIPMEEARIIAKKTRRQKIEQELKK